MLIGSIPRRKLFTTQIPVLGGIIALLGALFTIGSSIQLTLLSLGAVVIAHGLIEIFKAFIPLGVKESSFRRKALLLLVILYGTFASEFAFAVGHEVTVAFLMMVIITIELVVIIIYLVPKSFRLVRMNRSRISSP